MIRFICILTLIVLSLIGLAAGPRPVSAKVQGGTIVVPVAGDFQAALNAAQPGDTIIADAGAIFTGNFVLPVKSGDAFITIRSSKCDQLPVGVRVGPSQSSLMPTLATPNVGPVLRAPIFSHNYRLQCINFTQGAVPVDPVAGYTWGYNLIELGEGGSGGAQTTLESVPHHLEFDRAIIQPRDSSTMLHRGITLNSAFTTVTNSYIADIKWPGTETQAVGGWNGPGPFLIENNYLESAGVNILFGGAATLVPNLVPSDIRISRNTLTKRLEWKGQVWGVGTTLAVKNLFELKNAQRVTFTDNECRYSWPDGQTGWAVILNAFHDSPQNRVDDVEIARNVFRDVSNGINLRGADTGDTATRMHRIRIHDNLIENIGAFNGEGKAFQVLNGTEDVEFNHNTVRGAVASALILDSFPTLKHSGLKFTNNLMPHGLYGIFGNGGFFGTAALNQFASSWSVAGNALYAKPTDPAASLYPLGNYFPATEAEAVTLMGTDGLPVGMRSGSVTVPSPSPTVSPTPVASPTPTATPTPIATPVPTPLPSPAPSMSPTACTMTLNNPVVPQWGTGKLVVTFTELTQTGTVKATATSGQVTVDTTPKQVNGTSMIAEFWLQAKKKSSSISVNGPCGSKSVLVNVQ